MSVDSYARAAARRAEKLAKNGASAEQIEHTVNAYLSGHSINSGASPEQVAKIESNTQNITVLQSQLGDISSLLDEI